MAAPAYLASSVEDQVKAGVRAIFGAIDNAIRAAGPEQVYQTGQFGTKADGVQFGGYAEAFGTDRDEDGEFCENQKGSWTLTFTRPVPESVRLSIVEQMREWNGDAQDENGMITGSWSSEELAVRPEGY